jgi:uncharacterized membrane protein YtjA (UPF0391 family)
MAKGSRPTSKKSVAPVRLREAWNFDGNCPLASNDEDQKRRKEATSMLKWAIIFFLISIVAGALGYSGVAAGAAGISKILFALFLILAVIFVILLFAGISIVS